VTIRRFESSVTAVSWIPSEAISGPSKPPFEVGVTHYDEPPPLGRVASVPANALDADALGSLAATHRREE
jgi:hypothetical protein